MTDLYPYGSDTLNVPAYLARDDDPGDPGLAHWKQEHPDWFLAGTWTSPRRPKPPPSHQPGPINDWTVDPQGLVSTADLVARSDLSVKEFVTLAAAARDPASHPERSPAPYPTPPAASELAEPEPAAS